MGQLLLLRHGKSDWNADFETDHDRPINERGVQAARSVGLLLRGQSAYVPDQILCSTARRTRETLQHVISASEWDAPDVHYLDDLYLAAPSRALHILADRSVSVDALLLVGHQPTLSGLLTLVAGGNQVAFPTAALAVVDFDASDWKSGRLRAKGALRALIPPRLMSPVNRP